MRLPRPVRSRKATRIVDDFCEIIGLFGCLALARRAAQDLPVCVSHRRAAAVLLTPYTPHAKPFLVQNGCLSAVISVHQRSGILVPTRGQSLLIFYKKRNH